MAESNKLCVSDHPIFRHLQSAIKHRNFFEGVSHRDIRESIRERPNENPDEECSLAGNGLFFPTKARAHLFRTLESSNHIETGTRPGIESSLVRLHQSCLLANKLGEGSFGSVYEARDRVTGSLRAVKIIALKQGSASLSQSIESKLHKAMSDAGQNVPIYYDSWIENKKEVIIMEHCESTLATRIDALRFADMTVLEAEIRKIVSQLVPTLAKLHSLGYAHMDLKPENILFSSNFKSKTEGMRILNGGDNQEKGFNEKNACSTSPRARMNCGRYLLADFGICALLAQGFSDFDLLEGDQRYMPMEVFDLNISKKTQLDLTKVDIFSLGLILLKLMTGINLPDRGLEWSNLRSEQHIASLLANTSFSSNLKKVVISCVNRDANHRPTLASIMSQLSCSIDFKQTLTEKREVNRINRRLEFLKDNTANVIDQDPSICDKVIKHVKMEVTELE